MSIEDLLRGILEGNRQSQVPEPKLPPPPPPADEGMGHVMRCVVQIVALRQGFMGGMTSAWTGSGTIVDPSGVILTNCHVANPRAMGMSSPPADRLGIAITESADKPPAITYFAKVVAQSPELDLAVLQIVADTKGRRLRSVSLPAIDLGDSDRLQLGDELSIIGYPGIGGETVTFTSGNVSGFSSQKGVRASRAWMKTDATIAGGNSGGTAVNEHFQLVGVPTQAAAGSGVTPVDARPVVDTNRDGRIDQRDTPMAIGGFINGLRPVNLAYPLLRKAGVEIEVEDHGRVRRRGPEPIFLPEEPNVAHDPEFRELLFATSATDDGRPINPSTHFPSGIHTVFATFEHVGMKPGTPWSVIWTTGGEEIITQNNTWDDPPEGRKVVKISNSSGVPDGEYHLIIGMGRSIALEGKMMVGNPVDHTDSELSGTVTDSRTNRPIDDAVVLVLDPRASLKQFLRDNDERYVYTSTKTERDGTFTMPKQLPKGQAYSLVIAARGYKMVAVDGALRLSSGAPERANIGTIEMDRA